MRLFYGINIDVNKKLLDLISELKECFVDFQVAWTPLQNIHLTLLFIGETNADMLPQIINVGPDFYDVVGGELFVKCVNVWRKRKNSLICLELEKSDWLSQLQFKLENHVKPPHGNSVYKPHITLGRFKQKYYDTEESSLINKPLKHFITKINVSSFQLFESRLSQQGAKYFVKKEYVLK